jgi:AIPR protein
LTNAEKLNFVEEVKDTMKGFPAANNGQRFARAVLEFAYGLSHDEAINANACDGALDRGLDAYFTDSDNFYLMQFKYHDDPLDKSVQSGSIGPGQQLIHCWPYVSNLDHAAVEYAAKRIRQQLYDAAVAFHDEVDSKKVKLVVIEWADSSVKDAEASGQSWISTLPIGHPVASFETMNFESIRLLWEQRKVPESRYEGSVLIPFLESEGEIKLSSPHQATVVQILGRDLVSVYRDISDSLFDPNVRFDLSKTKYNIKIKESAKAEPRNFWYYNNGITILCSDFSWPKAGIIEIRRPGVVNGGQTIRQLADAGELGGDLKGLSLQQIRANQI